MEPYDASKHKTHLLSNLNQQFQQFPFIADNHTTIVYVRFSGKKWIEKNLLLVCVVLFANHKGNKTFLWLLLKRGKKNEELDHWSIDMIDKPTIYLEYLLFLEVNINLFFWPSAN